MVYFTPVADYSIGTFGTCLWHGISRGEHNSRDLRWMIKLTSPTMEF